MIASPAVMALLAIAATAAVLRSVDIPLFKNPHTGELRHFGVKSEETLLPAWLAMTVAGYAVYVLCSSS
jgi:hypothetical protein